MRKVDQTAILDFVLNAVNAIVTLLRSGRVGEAAVAVEELKGIVEAYRAAFAQYIPDYDFTGFPRGFFQQLTWVARNAGVILALLKAPDYLKPARERAKAFADRYFKELI